MSVGEIDIKRELRLLAARRVSAGKPPLSQVEWRTALDLCLEFSAQYPVETARRIAERGWNELWARRDGEIEEAKPWTEITLQPIDRTDPKHIYKRLEDAA